MLNIKIKYFLTLTLAVTFLGCGILQKKVDDPSIDFSKKTLTPKQSNELAAQVAGNFFYGQGFGDAIINIGGIIITPWYAIYALGNAVISLSGYEPLYVTNLLPKETKSGYDAVYNGVASVPGRGTALVARQQYRTDEIIKERFRKFLEK